MRHRDAPLLSVCLAVAAGCTPPRQPMPYREIRVRDPRQVSVMASTPGGPVTIAPAGGPEGVVYLPESAPPFFADDCFGARVVRSASGAIALQRLRCAVRDEAPPRGKWDGELLVDAEGRAVLFGEGHPVRREADGIHWVVTMSRHWTDAEGRRPRTRSAGVVSVELVASFDDVIDVTEHP
jgi:hypothetical protein